MVILDEQVRLIYLNLDNFFVRILQEIVVEWNHHLLEFVLNLHTNKFEKLLEHSNQMKEKTNDHLLFFWINYFT